jgi:hypothetical protein
MLDDDRVAAAFRLSQTRNAIFETVVLTVLSDAYEANRNELSHLTKLRYEFNPLNGLLLDLVSECLLFSHLSCCALNFVPDPNN